MRSLKKDIAGALTVGKLVGVAVMIFVGVALLPAIIQMVSNAQNKSTGATVTIIGLITILYSLGLAVAAIFWVVRET